MSTKTLRKRIALVAVSVLGAGLLSVTAVSTANAAAGDVTVSTATGVVTYPTLSGSAYTGTITSTGTVTFAAAAVASSVAELRISGGKFTSVTSGAVVSADGTRAYQSAYTTAIAGLVATPTTAGRNMVVTSYAGTSGTADGGTAAIAAAAASTTVVTTATITVVANGTPGVFAPSTSWFAIVNSGSTGSSTSNADTPYANIVNAGGTGVISYSLYDANSVALASTSIVYASVKSGACVIGLSTAPTAGTMVVGVSPSDLIYVAQADSTNTPATNCVVAITVDGVLATEKSFTFQGPVASIEVTSIGRGKTSTANTAQGSIVAKDAAGNLIGNVAITGATVSATDADKVSAVSVSANTARIASVNGGTAPGTTASTVGWTCTALSSNDVKVKWKTPNGTGGYIYSPEYSVSCGGDPANYTASFDKSSYVPGDVATLTITAKDSNGVLTNDAAILGSGSAAELVSLTGSNLTVVAQSTADTFSAGVKAYKFIVGSTEGSYNMVVNLPKWNSTTYNQSALTVPYTIKASSASVTNAEVLAAIVKLIASINKQIAALQKALKK